MKLFFTACCAISLLLIFGNARAEITECAPGAPINGTVCSQSEPTPTSCGINGRTPLLGADIIGPDAAYIQCLIVDAIKYTMPDQIARVTLPGFNPNRFTTVDVPAKDAAGNAMKDANGKVIMIPKKVYMNDWYFTHRGLGISIPRSNFVFDGAGATLHVRVDGGGYNGNVVGVQGLDTTYNIFNYPAKIDTSLKHWGAKFIGFDYKGRDLSNPNFVPTYVFPKGGTAVTVEFKPVTGDEPAVEVSRINGMLIDQKSEVIVENVVARNFKIAHEYNRPIGISDLNSSIPNQVITNPQQPDADYNNAYTNSQNAVNSVGIVFANNVTIDNVSVENSPQTSFGVVAEPNYPVTNVNLSNCSSINSGNEAIRYIFNRDASGAINRSGNGLGAIFVSGTIDSSTVINSGPVSQEGDSNVKPAERRTHVFYRAKSSPCSDLDLKNKSTSCNALAILNSNLDSSAEIDSSLGAPRLTIKGSLIAGGIALLGNTYADDNVSILGNNLQCYYAKGSQIAPDFGHCVFIQNIPGVKLISNQISGDRVSWLNSNYATTLQKNYTLDDSGNMVWR